MIRTLLTISFLTLAFTSFGQCVAKGDFSENFDEIEAGGGLPTCWTYSGASGTVVGVRAKEGGAHSGNNYISIYTLFAEDSDMYITTPELSNLNGKHHAEFYLKAPNEETIVQYGTMSDPKDAKTFVLAGAVKWTSGDYTKVTTEKIPKGDGQRYFTIKIFAPMQHTALRIDDFTWK